MESTSEDIEFVYFNKNIEYYTYLLDTTTPWITNTGVTPYLLLFMEIICM